MRYFFFYKKYNKSEINILYTRVMWQMCRSMDFLHVSWAATLPAFFLFMIVCFLSAKISDHLTTSLFFPPVSTLGRVYIGPAALFVGRAQRAKGRTRECHKRKWQFRWGNENSDERNDSVSVGLASDVRKFGYAREFLTLRRKKKSSNEREAPKNIFAGLSFPGFSSPVFRSVPTDEIDSQEDMCRIKRRAEIIFGSRPRVLMSAARCERIFTLAYFSYYKLLI